MTNPVKTNGAPHGKPNGAARTNGHGKPHGRLPKSKVASEEFKSPKRKQAHAHKPHVKHGVLMQLGHMIYCVLVITERIINALMGAYRGIFVVDERVDANFHKERGMKSLEGGKFDKAVEHFLESLEHENQDDKDTLYYLGMSYANLDNHEEALKYLKKADELGGQEGPDLALQISTCLMKLEEYPQALEYYKKVIDLIPEENKASSYYQMGTAYEKTEHLDEARDMYKKSIDLDPRDPLYYHALGFLYEKKGQHHDAIACFRKAMEVEREG